jgi:hypothetical protein
MLSDFLDDHVMTVTQKAYVGVPLSTLSNRGDVLERVVRRFLEHSTGNSTTDPVAGTNISGKKRGRNAAPYDFLLGDRRVEVKSAQLTWEEYDRYERWKARWCHIKPIEHDDLYLALYTPSGVFIFKHDGKFGVSTHGKAQALMGGVIGVTGPEHESSISKATEAVVEKMRPMLVACLKYE